MDFSFSDLNLQIDGLPPINFNSVETLPGLEARAAFTVNLSTDFREDVDIVPTVGDDRRQGRKHVYFRLDLQHYLRLHRQQRYQVMKTQYFTTFVVIKEKFPSMKRLIYRGHREALSSERNPGDIGKANGRKRKNWFSRQYFAPVMNIQEFYADSLGLEFCRAISNAISSSVDALPKQSPRICDVFVRK